MRAVVCFAAAVAALAPTEWAKAELGPYTPDVNTVFLYHFNEAGGGSVAANSATTGAAVGKNALSVNGTALPPVNVTTTLGGPAFSGFGASADLSAGNGYGLGVDWDNNGAFSIDNVTPNDSLPLNTFSGANNAFTLEAMVRLPSLTGGQKEIISADGSGTRAFLFRVNATGLLEFDPQPGGTNFTFDLNSLAGADAFVPNEWFHVALTYTEAGGVPTSKLYWTRVNASLQSAHLVAMNTTITAGIVAQSQALVIGNEGRSTGNMSEGLLGMIDEVRISNIDRGASQFIFHSSLLACDLDGVNGCTPADFNILAGNFQKSVTMRSEGDLNGDLKVNFLDYREWRAAFLAGGGSLADIDFSLITGVPEPTTSGLGFLAASGLGFFTRRRLTFFEWR